MWSKGNTIEYAIVIGEEEGVLYKIKGHLETSLVHETTNSCELWNIRLATHKLQSITLCEQSNNMFTRSED